MRARTSRFDLGELVVGDLAELEPHLRFEQLLAQRRVVVHLGLGGRDDLVEHEPEAADQQRVEDEHRRSVRPARSSFSRMLTKLYGGHGPVYLNVSLSKLRGDRLDAAVERLLPGRARRGTRRS